MKPYTLLIALLLAAGPAAGATKSSSAFDLVCTGTETPFGTGQAKPDARRYTLDLASKRWCRTAECSEGLAIERVTTDEITLRRSEPDATLEHRHFISRTTGEYVETIGGLGRTVGTCKPAPFSGFPKAKF